MHFTNDDMKNQITVKQFKELTDDLQDKLRYWLIEHHCPPSFVEQEGCLQPAPLNTYYLPNIGLMIEFLGENSNGIEMRMDDSSLVWYVEVWERSFSKDGDGTILCDNLWEAVKEKLAS